jgi:hypothetical protein
MLSGRVISKYVDSIPHLGRYLVRIVCVEPNTADADRIWSPWLRKVINVLNTAAMPVPVATPSSAPSRVHTLVTNSSTVGLEKRL